MLDSALYAKGRFTKEAYFFSLVIPNLIKKGILHILNATLVYLHGALIASDCIFLRALKSKVIKTFEASVFSLIFLYLIEKKMYSTMIFGYHFKFTLLWTRYSIKKSC